MIPFAVLIDRGQTGPCVSATVKDHGTHGKVLYVVLWHGGYALVQYP